MKIERSAAAIARDEQAIVLPIDPAPLGDAATFSGWPRQVARPLLRFESNEMDAPTSAIKRRAPASEAIDRRENVRGKSGRWTLTGQRRQKRLK
jgi:hypothetical protein